MSTGDRNWYSLDSHKDLVAIQADNAVQAVGGMISDCHTVQGASVNTPWWDYSGASPSLLAPRCEHEIGDETELEDGRIAGRCIHCGDTIRGRRMVGGLGLARLKTALVDALGDLDALPHLADELDRVEMMLELEEQGLEDARRLLATARRMITALMVPEVTAVE